MRRTLLRLRLPLALFIIAVLVSSGSSLAIFYYAFTTHVRGDFFRLETKYLDTDFPRNWDAFNAVSTNVTGNKYHIFLAPLNFQASIFFIVYDEDAARTYLQENNLSDLSDLSSINMVEVERVYNWVFESNSNAKLRFIENGTSTLSGKNAGFSTILLEDGFIDENGNVYNWTWTFISLKADGRIVQIVYHGVEDDYSQAYELFQLILNSTQIK